MLSRSRQDSLLRPADRPVIAIAEVNALIVSICIHVLCVKVEHCSISRCRVHGVVEIVEAYEQNLVQSLLSLWQMRPVRNQVVGEIAPN